MAAHDGATRWIADGLGMSPVWVEAAVVALLGAIAAWLIHRILVHHALPIAARTRTDVDELVLRGVATPAALAVLLLSLVAAAQLVVESPAWAARLEMAVPTVLVVLGGVAFGRIAGQSLLRRAQARPGLSYARGALLLGRFMKVVVAVVVGFTILALWNVSLTPLLASAGIIGIALALAAQDTLANLFAGIAVYADGLYEVGDYIVLDPGTESEIRGEVRDIGIRSTRLLTRDDVLVVIPNSVIANGRVVNESGQAPQYRIHVPAQVAYESDLEHVEGVMLRAADDHPLVLREPTPRVRFRAFADSGVRVELLCWIRDPRDRGPVVHDLLKRVHALFREEGIRIPFPQRDVHLVGERRDDAA